MARTMLPDPQFSAAQSGCIACAYPLEGLPQAGACPECGAPYGGDMVVLFGVPGRISGGPLWRRLVWLGLILGVIIFTQFFPLLLVLGVFGVFGLIAVPVLLIAGIIAMIASSRRERRGTERLVITEAGIRQTPLRGSETSSPRDEVYVGWGMANTLELRRISPYWRRLRIGYRSAPGYGMTVIFDAGVRCPDDVAPRVEQLLHAMLAARLAAQDSARAITTTPRSRAPGDSTYSG